MEHQKLKILALHGYRQSGDIFKAKIGSFRKIVQKYAELTFITAPHKVLGDIGILENDDAIETIQYSWWFNKDDVTFKGDRQGGPAIGFGKALEAVEEAYQKMGPFDGLLGFSQGACLAGLILQLQNRSSVKTNFKFAVIASGFCSGSLPHYGYYNDLIDMPSLHIFGQSDEIIPPELSKKLANMFNQDKRLEVLHPGGHFFPASSIQKQQYISFMRDMLIMKLEDNELNKSDMYITTQ